MVTDLVNRCNEESSWYQNDVNLGLKADAFRDFWSLFRAIVTWQKFTNMQVNKSQMKLNEWWLENNWIVGQGYLWQDNVTVLSLRREPFMAIFSFPGSWRKYCINTLFGWERFTFVEYLNALSDWYDLDMTCSNVHDDSWSEEKIQCIVISSACSGTLTCVGYLWIEVVINLVYK